MTSQEEALFFYAALCISVLLTRIPRIGMFFRVINTLVHESGHAFMAIATNGSVLKVELFSDLSGMAKTASGSWFSRFMVSLSGYMFSSVMAWVLFFMANAGLYEIVLWVLLGFGLVNLLFFVRNSYGIFWLLSFVTGVGTVLYFNNAMANTVFVVCALMLLLGDSFISTLELFFIAVKKPANAGDARNLKDLTHLPTFFWALVFLCFAGYVLWDVVHRFFPPISLIFK
jgi:hypothetical protein